MKYKIESWRVSTYLKEDDSKTEVYYSSLESAKVAMEDAIQKHCEFLNSRNDIKLIPLPIGILYDSSQKKYEITRTEYEGENDNIDLTTNIVWWRIHPKGVLCMKDYFYLDYDIFEREVLE